MRRVLRGDRAGNFQSALGGAFEFGSRGEQEAELGFALGGGGVGAVQFVLKAGEERDAEHVGAFEFHYHGRTAFDLAGLVGRGGGGEADGEQKSEKGDEAVFY